eukprot:CAMPEP_0113654284 /NCGR_PEP_ID=MMETSP0017_2-20120614/29074_1 /TAXON_ID=2856 /ORGANISM="Cylindrotheca closterium" /LENGTH=475 /DNA_ID=CAMNT_0000567421 /DNA_START=83 /DNA_END=1510 /DNA_ORIENTATION=- /assembly_acc=CAM_ASM_000147
MRCSHLLSLILLQLGLGTAFQQRRIANSVAFTRTDERVLQRPSTCLWQANRVDRQTAWNDKYQELVDFYEKNGHFTVKKPSSLYTWIATQRRKRRGTEGCIPHTDEQTRLLDEIEFPWGIGTGTDRQTAWNAKYQELVEFKKKHGHLRAECRSSLYDWQEVQRRKRSGTKRYSPLTDDQVRLLDEIDFPWDARRQTLWNDKYQELVEFKKKHGHLRAEYRSSLYVWQEVQRRKRSGTGGCIPHTDEQIRLLDDIDFQWDMLDQWNDKYQELVEFKKKHGHLRVGRKSSIYDWQEVQRRKRNGMDGYSPLTDDQVRLLDEIDFPWDARRQTLWNDKYQELVEFKKKHGHLRAEYRSSLYVWQEVQRRKRSGTGGYIPLTDEQIRLLDDIDFPWGTERKTAWNNKYQELVEFKKNHGHLRAEYRSSLFLWQEVQRRKRNGTKGYSPLTDEQIRLLDDIDFPWTPTRGRGGVLHDKEA